MATQSIIAACLKKFDGLSPANFPGGLLPKLYFDVVPQTDEQGNQIRVTSKGYCVLIDKGQDVALMGFPLSTREIENFDLEIYFPKLSDCDQAALAVKRNGGTTAQKLGFDFGTLSDLASPRGTFVIRRLREQRGQAGIGISGALVHRVTLSYRVEILETA